MISGDRTSLWLIEGYYGKPWPDEVRLLNYGLIGLWGYEGAIYAPKADRSLRSEWRRPFTAEELSKQRQMASTAAASGLAYGVGLSPMNAWDDWCDETRQELIAKLTSLHACGCQVLSLQFDDMRGDVPRLARLQAKIIAFVNEHWSGSRLIVCPTYYSDDPVLASVFGTPPSEYLEDLTSRLPVEIDVYWTGPKVVSGAIEPDHIRTVTARMGRRPFLWDNYPVNDGARTSRHLFLGPPEGKGALMSGILAGYAANPMLQPHLSQIPLRALADLVRRGQSYSSGDLLEDAIRDCVAPASVPLFIRNAESFAKRGLDGFSPHEVRRIRRDFDKHTGPHAREVSQWLSGGYAFDPACLTD